MRKEPRFYDAKSRAGAWVLGRIHARPRLPKRQWRKLCRLRQRAFMRACQAGNPGIVLWPEFAEELRRLKIEKAYVRRAYSVTLIGLLIAEGESAVHWRRRARNLRHRGQDPMLRDRYRQARDLFAELKGRARLLQELNRAEERLDAPLHMAA